MRRIYIDSSPDATFGIRMTNNMSHSIQPIADKKTWNSFVEKHAPLSYFQSWEWGDVEKKSGRIIWRLAVIQNKKDIVGVCHIIKITAKRGTFLHLRHGPIFVKWEKKLFNFWLDHVKQLANKEHASFIRINPLLDPSQSTFYSEFHFRPAPIHNMDAEIVSVIDVTKSEEELLSRMRKNTRNLIRKGLKMDIVVTQSSDMQIFLDLYKDTFTRHDFVPHQAIASELEVFAKEKNAELLVASFEGKPLAAAIVCYFGNQALYRHGASVKSSVPAAYVLQWEIIRRVKKRGLPEYNLFGIADTDRPNHPWWGLTLFKKGFGGETKHYLHAQDLPLSPLYWVGYTIEKIRKIKRGY